MSSVIDQGVRTRWLAWALLGLALVAGPTLRAAPSATEPLDYRLLTHELSIDSLRAGAHSAKGLNTYTFLVTLVGLVNGSEERNLDFDKRKKVSVDIGAFGDTSIESLAVWKPDLKLKDFKQIKIEGQAIRELVAQTMTDFKVPESDVRVQVSINMVMKKKKWFVLNADEAIAKISYAPVPATKFEVGLRTNQDLVIEDDRGTFVKIAVRYDSPAIAPVSKAAQTDQIEPHQAPPVAKKT